jgi:hypothetical protein
MCLPCRYSFGRRQWPARGVGQRGAGAGAACRVPRASCIAAFDQSRSPGGRRALCGKLHAVCRVTLPEVPHKAVTNAGRYGLGGGIAAVEEMAVTVTVVKLVAFLAVVVFSVGVGGWLGLWAARKQGRIPQGESGIGHLRAGMRRRRRARRELLTLGERVVAWTMVFLSAVLAPAGVIILLLGGSGPRSVGIALLVLALFVMAVPISPILQARVRRRQRASRSR